MRLGIGRSPVHGLSGLDPSDDTALQVQDFLEPGLAELFRGAGASPASAAVDRYRTLLVKAIQALIDEIVRVYIYVHCAVLTSTSWISASLIDSWKLSGESVVNFCAPHPTSAASVAISTAILLLILNRFLQR